MSNPTVLYVHGFASAGGGKKATFMDYVFSDTGIEFLSPTLPYEPEKAMAMLTAMVKERSPIVVIGTSLGGFYCLALNALHKVPAFAINPVINVSVMARHIGENTNLSTGEVFIYTAGFQEQLVAIKKQIVMTEQSDVYIYLTLDDEVLPYEETIKLIPENYKISISHGGHRFSTFDCMFEPQILPIIEGYLGEIPENLRKLTMSSFDNDC